MGVAPPGGKHHIEVVEAAVPHQQHATPHRAQQAKAANALTRVAGPEAAIDDTMGATFHQIDAVELGKGTGAACTGMTPKHRSIGRCIGDIFSRAINGHEA